MNTWLGLITTLPSENATERQRVWRTLKASGAAVLRDGVYLLPERPDCRTTMETLAADIRASKGSAWVLTMSEPDDGNFTALFDHSDDYVPLLTASVNLLVQATVDNAADTLKQLRKLRKTFAALGDIDFFPGLARQQTDMALQQLESRCNRLLSPDEPNSIAGTVPQRELRDYQQQLWATRQRPWIDRLASAWLIKRFIDPAAKFLWLELPADCPAHAIGFDFDGARFSHVGELVTFEVLLASFNLQQPALLRLGTLVHCLDVGGIQPPEAAGLETILAGLRRQISNDDKLLTAAFAVFDGLHTAFSPQASA